MTPDLALVIGILCLGLAFPSLVAAFSEARAPRTALILGVVGGGLIAWAITATPGGYAFGDIPDVFVRVVGGLLN
ncbi:hypothetical protein DXV76_04090 [Rhodobacteraceae bacterium CCMM004]|nr:hypothetical protein DXV76_04090 [Rhodobacteraceae bacterium CCMM004]